MLSTSCCYFTGFPKKLMVQQILDYLFIFYLYFNYLFTIFSFFIELTMFKDKHDNSC